jgi:hypothetical protein
MSDDDFGFALPAFQPGEALVALRRSLRELKLAERGNGLELRGRRVVELTADTTGISARLASKPALTPEWDTRVLRSAGDVRKLLDEVRKRLERWQHED